MKAAKNQGHSFKRFYVIKGKPIGGRGKVETPPPRLGLEF